MDNFLAENININIIYSQNDIYSYHNIDNLNSKKLNIDNDHVYNLYINGNVFTTNDIIVTYPKKNKKKKNITDIFINGDLYINNHGALYLIDAIAYSTIPKFIYRKEKINNIKNKINGKRKKF